MLISLEEKDIKSYNKFELLCNLVVVGICILGISSKSMSSDLASAGGLPRPLIRNNVGFLVMPEGTGSVTAVNTGTQLHFYTALHCLGNCDADDNFVPYNGLCSAKVSFPTSNDHSITQVYTPQNQLCYRGQIVHDYARITLSGNIQGMNGFNLPQIPIATVNLPITLRSIGYPSYATTIRAIGNTTTAYALQKITNDRQMLLLNPFNTTHPISPALLHTGVIRLSMRVNSEKGESGGALVDTNDTIYGIITVLQNENIYYESINTLIQAQYNNPIILAPQQINITPRID
jgi:hypothetical protein